MARPGPTRRRLLAGAGSGLIGGGLLAAAFEPAATGFERGKAGNVSEDAIPVEEADTPYAVWQYRPTLLDGDFERTLPINLVGLRSALPIQHVVEVFEQAGWVEPVVDQPRVAYDRAEDTFVPPRWAGGTSVYGVAGRVHVRIWEVAETVAIQAHVDTAPRPVHRMASFADARATVELLFEQAGWTVDSQAEHLGNDQSPDHDGYATVISR